MDEDFLTALGGFDEAESAVVVPGFEGSGEVHGEGIYWVERKSNRRPRAGGRAAVGRTWASALTH